MCRGYSTLLYLLTGPVSAAMHTFCLGRRCVANSFNRVPAENRTLDFSTTLTLTDRCSTNAREPASSRRLRYAGCSIWAFLASWTESEALATTRELGILIVNVTQEILTIH